MYYDPRFLAHHIPALNESTSKGLQLGFFVRSSDGQPSYRVTYNRSIDAVSASLDDLRKQFEAYIPVLAALHVSKEPLFAELEPIGLSWVEDLISGDIGALLEESSLLLQDTVTADQISEMRSQLLATSGPATAIDLIRAQFYEKFSDVPESVSLFYRAQMEDESSYEVMVSLHEESGQWRAMGFRFLKQN